MADALDSGICSLIGLGRCVVLQPDLPATVLLNPSVSDDEALAIPYVFSTPMFPALDRIKFRITILGCSPNRHVSRLNIPLQMGITDLKIPRHIVKGQWFANMIPVKVVGSGLAIQFFYYNMRRLGHGLKSEDASSKALFGFNLLFRDCSLSCETCCKGYSQILFSRQVLSLNT